MTTLKLSLCAIMRHALMVACFLTLPGCVVQRGIDFGHWAHTAPTVPIIRFITPTHPPPAAPISQLAFLPLLGDLDTPYLELLENHLLEEAKLSFKAPITSTDRNGRVATYVTMNNLLPMGGDVWNSREIARMGQILGVSHVICARVRNWRQYEPQQLTMDFIVVETIYGTPVVEMLAIFDAKEQQVVLAMDQYLRNRSARKYSRQSLDIIMRSPQEYSRFTAAQCMNAMAEKLWSPAKSFKLKPSPADNMNTH